MVLTFATSARRKRLLKTSPNMLATQRTDSNSSSSSCSSTLSKGSSSSMASQSGMEMQVRNLLDVTFRYNWILESYVKRLEQSIKASKGKGSVETADLDSPPFEVNVNGLHTKWSLAVRFWIGPNGERLSNPVVVCLNLLESNVDTPEEIRVRYQFGIFNDVVKQNEICPAGGATLTMETTDKITSIGYRDLCILDRHVNTKGDVQISCKIMLVRKAVELHTLPLDLLQILMGDEFTDATLFAEGREFRVHKSILCARSPVFAAMFKHTMREGISSRVAIEDLTSDTLQSLLHYIYTDQVENLESQAQTLLAAAEKYQLPGLKSLCERSLIDSITPANVAAMLLLADSFRCDNLKRAALAYCEDNANCIVKNVGWKVMEEVHPELFQEACEAVIKDGQDDCHSSPKGGVHVP